jgi:hypothetical protein
VTRFLYARRTVVALVVVGSIAVAACGGDAKVTETPDGKVTVEGDGHKSQVTIDGERGAKVTYNLQQVPGDFPDEVPRPVLDLTSATAATRGGKQYFQLAYGLGRSSARSALGAYATRLGGAGFSVDALDGPASNTAPAPLRATGNGWRVVAIATSGRGAASMIVTVDNA